MTGAFVKLHPVKPWKARRAEREAAVPAGLVGTRPSGEDAAYGTYAD